MSGAVKGGRQKARQGRERNEVERLHPLTAQRRPDTDVGRRVRSDESGDGSGSPRQGELGWPREVVPLPKAVDEDAVRFDEGEAPGSKGNGTERAQSVFGTSRQAARQDQGRAQHAYGASDTSGEKREHTDPVRNQEGTEKVTFSSSAWNLPGR